MAIATAVQSTTANITSLLDQRQCGAIMDALKENVMEHLTQIAGMPIAQRIELINELRCFNHEYAAVNYAIVLRNLPEGSLQSADCKRHLSFQPQDNLDQNGQPLDAPTMVLRIAAFIHSSHICQADLQTLLELREAVRSVPHLVDPRDYAVLKLDALIEAKQRPQEEVQPWWDRI